MLAMLMVFLTCDELGLVLWGVGPILRNECGHRDKIMCGQNYVALNLILDIQCCTLFIVIVQQWNNTHNNRLPSRRSEIVMLCYLIYINNTKIHFTTSYVPNSKFKLHRTCKFCHTYKLQHTHYFFQAKTGLPHILVLLLLQWSCQTYFIFFFF